MTIPNCCSQRKLTYKYAALFLYCSRHVCIIWCFDLTILSHYNREATKNWNILFFILYIVLVPNITWSLPSCNCSVKQTWICLLLAVCHSKTSSNFTLFKFSYWLFFGTIIYVAVSLCIDFYMKYRFRENVLHCVIFCTYFQIIINTFLFLYIINPDGCFIILYASFHCCAFFSMEFRTRNWKYYDTRKS